MKKLIGAWIFLTLSWAQAGPPVKFPNCAKNIQLRSVPNGAGVYFDITCSVGYVLPPAKGRFEISDLTPNSKLDRCPAYESSQRALVNLHARLEKITKQLNSSEGASNDGGFGDPSLDPGSSNSEPELKPVDPGLVAEMRKVMELISITQESLKSFDQNNEGLAVGKINYFLDWNNLVTAYQEANPKIRFVRLPLEAGRLVFSRKLGVNGELVTGAVAHQVNGIENTSAISPDGTLQPGTGSVIMGDAISGRVVLNYSGACPFVRAGKLQDKISKRELENYLSAVFTYRYSLQGLKGYDATFNLSSIAKHIQESHTSGGLFSSHTSTSLIQTNSYADEFVFAAHSDQDGYEYEPSLKAEVKTELINRVLRELASVTGQPVGPPSLIPPSAHGATVAADELQKYPNVYAQIGAGALRVLDSIFGNSEAVATYIRERNGVTRERVDERRMFSYSSSSAFEGK